MDIGTGIAISVGIVTVAGSLIAIFKPGKGEKINGNGRRKLMSVEAKTEIDKLV